MVWILILSFYILDKQTNKQNIHLLKKQSCFFIENMVAIDIHLLTKLMHFYVVIICGLLRFLSFIL